MHLEFSEPVLVSMGPKSREAGWGPYQFPALYRTSDGKILLTFQDFMDLEADYGSELTVYLSEDEGKSWTQVRENDYLHEIGQRLQNGDLLHWIEPGAIPFDDPDVTVRDRADFLGHRERKNQYFYRWEDIQCPRMNQGFLMRRFKAGSREAEIEDVRLLWPNRVHLVSRNYLCCPFPSARHMRMAPNGDLWIPHQHYSCHPETGEFNIYAANCCFRSRDQGHTWELMHFLSFDPAKYPDDNVPEHLIEGFDENDIGFAPDGSLFRVIRTCGMYPRDDRSYHGNSYIVHSTDGGESWSDPEYFDDRGVLPNIFTFRCGATIVGYGRPGLFVRPSFDPSCRKWEDRIEIIHSPGTPNDSVQCVDVHGTCSYCDFLEIDDHTAGFTYSDFRVKDENGEMRKCIMFRTITVVED